MDKDQIKKELIDKSNDILQKYSEPDIVEDLSIMNMAAKTVFLGSLKVYNTEIVPNVIKDLNKDIVKDPSLGEGVAPCCAPSYIHISFNVTILN